MKKLLRVLLVPCVFFVPDSAKAFPGDSLLTITSLPDDTGKVTALNKLALELSSSNSDSAIHVSMEALLLAHELKWEEGIAKSFHLLGFFNSSKGENKLSLDYYFKALDIWEKQEASAAARNKNRVLENKWKTLGNIGVVYMDLGDYPRALDFYFRALKISKTIANKSAAA